MAVRAEPYVVTPFVTAVDGIRFTFLRAMRSQNQWPKERFLPAYWEAVRRAEERGFDFDVVTFEEQP